MKQFLINPSRGVVVGAASRKGEGWSFLPFTTAHGGSRKVHATKEAASLRYQSPSCRWIEAENPADAAKQVKVLKAAYDRNEPCSKCVHYVWQAGANGEPEQCTRGAAPAYALNLGQCAKFLSEGEFSQDIYASTVDPLMPGEKLNNLSSGAKLKAGHLPDCAVGITSGAPNKADAGQPSELREDVVIYKLSSREIVSFAGRDMGETGHHTASLRLMTVCSRLNERYDAACVPAGKYKVGDVLPDDL